MIIQPQLESGFGEVFRDRYGYFRFQDVMPKYTYNYGLSVSEFGGFLTVVENIVDDEFSASIIRQVPEQINRSTPTLVAIEENFYGLSHMIIVPSEFHGYFKGRLDDLRANLFLCVPIYRCEFSGTETVEEFKALRWDIVPILDWGRLPSPKLIVYFDNPKIGSGNGPEGSLTKFPALIREVRNLEAVANGFIELTNYAGKVLEVLSDELDSYTIIYDRTTEYSVNQAKALSMVERFAFVG
ncbi:hypothetical protein [Pseudomonas eucalypticola]|uniref:Uncharacterized protein n=1 Tax=Pseudomonas eucalypticola TaxID=2599595 RepID=A0A7D5HTJ7_9PSED|nr:hypothetical protein [Pseudomonas eucalypticola]QKZ02411.1 hypothetical protein HWQ56_00835 [Pseudomonas eucalypticola]